MANRFYYWTCRCGAEQAMLDTTNAVLRQSNAIFFCVHGHESHYPEGQSVEQKLQKQLDAERQARQRAEQRIAEKADEVTAAREEARHERNRANGYKGHATRITKRAKAGVCPCCNRTFKALAAHMANKHPQFTPLEIDAPATPKAKAA